MEILSLGVGRAFRQFGSGENKKQPLRFGLLPGGL
jgi:hypothetical protein